MNTETPPAPTGRLIRSEHRVAEPAENTHCLQQTPRYLLYSALPWIAALSSLSPAVATMLALPNTAPLTTKAALPLAVWTPLALASYGFQWYFNGRRADGLLDARVQPSLVDAEEAPGFLAIALLASLPNFTDALLYAHAIRPQHDALFAFITLALGTGKWLTWCLTDLQAAWRKLSEDTHVKALGEQSWAKPLYSNAYWLNVILREIYPSIIGLVYAQAFFRLEQSASPFSFINILLAALVFQGAALTARNFDIRQNHDCAFGDSAFAMQGILANSSQLMVRTMGRALNGQLLDDVLAKLKLSTRVRTAIILGLNGAGFVAALQQLLTTFLISSDSAAINRARKALVMRYYAGEATSLTIGTRLSPAVLPLAAAIASMQAYVRAATVRDQLSKDCQQIRVRQITVTAALDL